MKTACRLLSAKTFVPSRLSLTWLRWVWVTLLPADIGAAEFTPLTPLDPPRIVASAPAFDENYLADNLLKPVTAAGHRSDYASRGLGARTFVDFDFGKPVRLAAFRHVQRTTPDTIAAAKLLFSDVGDFSTASSVAIQHVDRPGATTLAAFPPVTARYVRWQVSSVLPERSPNVGGQSIEFYTPGNAEPRPRRIDIEARPVPVLERHGEALVQPVRVRVHHPYAETTVARLRVADEPPREIELHFGEQTFEYRVAAVPETSRSLKILLEIEGESIVQRETSLPPARLLTVYILPHSHTDIGYTAVQTDIEEKQINNLLQGIADARRTADYPEGARFVWNVEVLWAADLLNQRLPAAQQAEFLAAVKCGQVALNGMYLNELTGLCRPVELLRLFRYATQLAERTGVPVDSAMISDVPGYTWATVTAMAQAGIRYFSVAPNYFDRIGTILVEWENKPFWWIGPDGQSKVLVWIPFWGYAMSHRYGRMSPALVEDFCEGLEKREYPYDIAYVRWAGHGDNAVPDPAICDFVREWNMTHASPRFVISSTSEAFRAFEKKYGECLPEVRGDWTPYWEDGAGSSAAETALNRASSERLVQAEALWAMLSPRDYPAAKFETAWNNVLLYSEHTWGAFCSISEPANPFTTDQWTIKQAYATVANLQSRQLLGEAAQVGEGFRARNTTHEIDIFNTSSWSRSELVLLPQELSGHGDFVLDDHGQPVPSQRLASRELAVWVHDLPPFSGRRYTLTKAGPPTSLGSIKAGGAQLENATVRVRVDEVTGGITELRATGIDLNLADTRNGQSLNEYLYLIGDDPAGVQRNGPVRLRVRDQGPLVTSLLLESEAPGCHQLRREIRLVAGGDYVEIIDTVDKKRLEAASYHAREGKESVNFGFAFNVPGGGLRLDLPLAVIRPDEDQIASACRNWFSIGLWADVANDDFGVTWVTLDTPLVQVGGLTATLLNSQTNPDVWRRTTEHPQKLYAWAMNNHWGTNYRAYQEGPTRFRFVLRPHRGRTSDAENTRFAAGFSQPLIAVHGRGKAPNGKSLLRLAPGDVLAVGLKPSDDGAAWVLRLFGAGNDATTASIQWGDVRPVRTWLSDTSERPLRALSNEIPIPAHGVATIRADLP
jgi:hypothetical protein